MILTLAFPTLLLMQAAPAIETCDLDRFVEEHQAKRAAILSESSSLSGKLGELRSEQLALAQRIADLNRNPKPIKSMFDPNYNVRALRAREFDLAKISEIYVEQLAHLKLRMDVIISEIEEFSLKCGTRETVK